MSSLLLRRNPGASKALSRYGCTRLRSPAVTGALIQGFVCPAMAEPACGHLCPYHPSRISSSPQYRFSVRGSSRHCLHLSILDLPKPCRVNDVLLIMIVHLLFLAAILNSDETDGHDLCWRMMGFNPIYPIYPIYPT